VYALSGVVRVAGVPTAGATVALLADRQIIASVVTDRSGAYGFPEVSNFSFSGALVGASMPRYFTDTKYVLMTGPRQLDFELIEAEQIPFGQMVSRPVGDARCASLGYGGMGGALCRRLAVTVPASGTLVVMLSATPTRDFRYLHPDPTRSHCRLSRIVNNRPNRADRRGGGRSDTPGGRRGDHLGRRVPALDDVAVTH
jgi:hypothetical protein